MPIEIVCKIQFAEEDEKQKEEEEGDKESLIEEPSRPRAHDLAAFAGTSTLHGLGHICGSGRLGVRQTLWAFAFLLSLAFFLSQSARSALLYLERPHLTALGEEAAREMLFPAVTICNINRFRHSALSDADIFHLANMTGLPPKDREGHRAADLLYPDPDMADILHRTGHQLDDMLQSCNFSGEKCSSRNFTVGPPAGAGTSRSLCSTGLIDQLGERGLQSGPRPQGPPADPRRELRGGRERKDPSLERPRHRRWARF
ncbi:acid-sensing ion channel 4-A-like [Pangshura tecta]